jgi:hypothetical protein
MDFEPKILNVGSTQSGIFAENQVVACLNDIVLAPGHKIVKKVTIIL